MAAAATTKTTPTGYAQMDFCEMVRADHAAIRELLDQFDGAKAALQLPLSAAHPPAGASQGTGAGGDGGGGMERVFALARQLIGEVSAHASAEERVLYPLVKSRLVAVMGPSLAATTSAGGGGGGGGAGAAAGEGAEPPPQQQQQQQRGAKPSAAQQRDAEALYERVLADDQCNKELLQWLDRRVPGDIECSAEGCEKPRGLLGSGERGASGHAALGGCGDVERALLLSTLAKLAAVEREHMEMEEALLLSPLEALLTADEQADFAAQWRAAKEGAPAHPHPRGPVAGVAASIAHPAAAALDKAAEALRAGGARVAGMFAPRGQQGEGAVTAAARSK